MRLLRRLRPPTPLDIGVSVAVVFYCAVWFFDFWRVSTDGWIAVLTRPSKALLGLQAFPLIVVSFLYGFLRAGIVHPFFRAEYRKWLERTHWSRSYPLPLGPIDPTVADGLVLVLITLASTRTLAPPLLPVSITILGYAATVMAASFATGGRAGPFAIAVLLGAVPQTQDHPYVLIAVFAALYVALRLDLEATLSRWPWRISFDPSFKIDIDDVGGVTAVSPTTTSQRRLGWPYSRLSPAPHSPVTTREDRICLTIIFAWWVTATGDVSDIVGRFPLALVVLRIVRLLVSHRPPISLWGRLRTGRLLIPGYDSAFIAPLVSACCIFELPAIGTSLGWPTPIAFGVSAGIGLALLFTIPPRIEDWTLSGSCSISSRFDKRVYTQL